MIVKVSKKRRRRVKDSKGAESEGLLLQRRMLKKMMKVSKRRSRIRRFST